MRASLGRMLLHLKQMAGRLIRSETDRGLVVIVEARPGRGYFKRLADAFPDGVAIERAGLADLPRITFELGLGPNGTAELKTTHSTIGGIDGP
jgi:Rad3-related DNA helicase